MTSRQTDTFRAIAKFTLVAAASAAAASLWAQARPEPGLLLDAQSWQEDVVPATSPWPEDGWFRLVPQDRALLSTQARPGVNVPTAHSTEQGC